jgi:hypothetical protein
VNSQILDSGLLAYSSESLAQVPRVYTLLLRVVGGDSKQPDITLGCTDAEVTPVRDEFGRVKFDLALGPFFRLKEGERSALGEVIGSARGPTA